MLPPYLRPSDLVAIVSPSGSIQAEYIDGAIKKINEWGLLATEGEFARSKYGRFAASTSQRVDDLQKALDDKRIKAIICSRGGYGLAQIIDKLDFTLFSENPKWLIGFSDITVLHNVISNLGVASIHSIMAKHITELPNDAQQVLQLRNILFGELPKYNIPVNPFNRCGNTIAPIVGGNLSVMMGLRGSGYDLDYANAILFIEDIAEEPYKIDRMIQNLRFSGVLAQLSGLIVGQFTDCNEDPLMMQTVEQIISNAVADYNYPVCFNFPAGHVDYNLPVILGAKTTLKVSNECVSVTFWDI